MSPHEELRSSLEANPESLRSDQLMDELFWDTLDLLKSPDRRELARQATSTSELARQFFKRAEPGASSWRLWYAGQLQGIAGLLRALLSRELALETSALLRSRKHALPILKALTVEDSRLSDLAKTMNLDESHLGRELKLLAHRKLLETVKEGRERWARITIAGRTALAEVLGDASATPEGTQEWEITEQAMGDLFPLTDKQFEFSNLQQIAPNANMLTSA